MKNWPGREPLDANEHKLGPPKLSDNLVRQVVARTHHRVLVNDLLFLLVKGFGSILLGLMERSPEKPPLAPGSVKRETS